MVSTGDHPDDLWLLLCQIARLCVNEIASTLPKNFDHQETTKDSDSAAFSVRWGTYFSEALLSERYVTTRLRRQVFSAQLDNGLYSAQAVLGLSAVYQVQEQGHSFK